jgi:hypothetical protein
MPISWRRPAVYATEGDALPVTEAIFSAMMAVPTAWW